MAVTSTSVPDNDRNEFTVEGAHAFDRRTPLRWLLSHLLRYKGLAVLFLLSTVSTGVLMAAVPRLTGTAFDVVLQPAADHRRLIGITLVILVLVLARGLLNLVGSFAVETLGQRLERDTRDELYLSLLGKSQTFHNRQRVGDLMARANNDVRMFNPMMNPGVALILESLMGVLVPLVFIAFLDLRLLLAPVIFIVLFAVTLRRYMRQLSPVSSAMREQFGALNAGLNETITGIAVVKSAVQESQEKRKFAREASRFKDLFVRQGIVQARYLPLLIVGIVLTGAFAHGLILVYQGHLSTGDLVAYMGLMSLLRFPAFISIFTFSLVQLGFAGAERVLELLRAETELDENVGGRVGRIEGDIRFEGVTFAYGEEALQKPILQGVSFHVPAGSTAAIVGQTGSGKSSLTRLLNRTYDAGEGSVLVDGFDVREWNLASLRSQVSVIEQDVFLFSRSVADNISFGVGKRATRDAIVAAAKAAQAHDFILGFAEGYDTVIGERGETLSGGQRQRLAIARALLTDPRVLILDDSTSAVDSATEDAIQRAIDHVLQGRTTFLITHRLSQIRRADVVLVLHEGTLIDHGNHDELLARCKLYQRIFARFD